ncbi:hypothetical protein Tco_1369136 [Tanacetum coccineum]
MKRLHPLRHHPLVDDDLDEEEVIREIEKKNLENVDEDETLEIDEIVNIKESRNHPLENVIGKLNQRTLRSQAQNKFNFYYFISTIEPKNVNEALGDESWIEIMPRKSSEDYKNTRHCIPIMSHEFRSPIKEKLRNLDEHYIHETKDEELSAFVLAFKRLPKPLTLKRLKSISSEFQMFIEFVIQNQLFSYSPEDFAQILDVPCEGACLCFMLYCVVHSERFNLAYYMAKRMEWVTKQARLILPYGMLLTRLFKFIMNEYPELYNESYILYDRVMNPLAAQLERKLRRDRGTRRGRHSTSLSFAFDQPSSSHLNDDDDDGNDEGTSHESTPSPIRYVNSLTNQVPQVFQNPPNINQNMEPFYTRQTEILNRQVQLRDAQRGGVRSIRKILRRLWRNIRK